MLLVALAELARLVFPIILLHLVYFLIFEFVRIVFWHHAEASLLTVFNNYLTV